MTIHIKSTAKVAKTFRVAREKLGDDNERVIAHLRVSDIMIDRDQLDELCGQPIGWSRDALFDEFGAPRARLTLSLAGRDLMLTGGIDGGRKSTDPKLRLKAAGLDGITLELIKHGALFAAQLSWTAAGDEVDDVAGLLGRACNLDVAIEDGGQRDLLAGAA